LLLFLCLFLVKKADKNSESKVEPNVLLLYMDDLRPELATYGKPQIISPNIDVLKIPKEVKVNSIVALSM